jgi:hypothetical protein
MCEFKDAILVSWHLGIHRTIISDCGFPPQKSVSWHFKDFIKKTRDPAKGNIGTKVVRHIYAILVIALLSRSTSRDGGVSEILGTWVCIPMYGIDLPGCNYL